jgi:hypothetical protein
MTIPPFVKLEHDAAARKAYVTVKDREVKKQREMWGMRFTMASTSHADFKQVQLAHIYKTTSSAYQKGTQLFSD